MGYYSLKNTLFNILSLTNQLYCSKSSTINDFKLLIINFSEYLVISLLTQGKETFEKKYKNI